MIGDRRRLVLPRRRSTVNQKFMIRKCFVMQVKHGAEEEYRQRHSPIWKELEDVLRTHGVHNYSIALHSETGQLFAYAEIEDEARWNAIAQTPTCRRWWDYMADLMEVNADRSPGAVELICGQVPDTRLFPEAWHVCGPVAFAPYALPGSLKLGARIAEQCGSIARPNCVVPENHGVVVGGHNLAQAFERFETLEFAAQIILNARLLGQVNYLSEAQIELSKRPRILSPEGSPQTPSSREKELRKEICDFIQRAYEHRLMTSTWGSFSVRVNEDIFVVTLSHVDRREMGLEDLVLIRDGKHTPNQMPSRAAGLHRAIYRAHPEIQ